MDQLNKTISSFTGGNNNEQQSGDQNQQGGNNHNNNNNNDGGVGGLLGGLGDKINSAAGGGRESEKNEDMLDKGIDYVQENFMGQGKQDDESAIEQAKDEQISDFIRGQYKSTTGKDFPVADKDTKLG